ncbi:MAG: hypothetical protein AAF541_16645 [Pseudomonadota bacterium]
MILSKGSYIGNGQILVEGASLGEDLEIQLGIEEDREGITLTGEIAGAQKGAISIRVAPDEVGTYVIDARVGGVALDGRGKLESEPNLILLWNEGQTQSVSVALFKTSGGVGCRGFWQENGRSKTWEILFKLKQQVIGGSNVVTLRRR